MASSSTSFPAMDRRRSGCGILFALISLLFFSFLPSPSDCQKLTVPAMYVFGDSLVDVGNNNHIPFSLLKADFPHNGVDYPGGEATGRFSNGKNAADFIVMQDKCLTFDKQIDLFSKVYGAIVQKLGSAATRKHLSHSIVTIVIGSNDLLGYFKTDPSQRPKPPNQFVDSLVSTLRAQLRRIYNLGARKMVFVGTTPIGCSPAMRIRNATRGCIVEANYGSILFNERANSLLEGMKSELGDMSYSFFDAYAVVAEYIKKPATYGFADVQSACCGGLGDLNAKLPCIPIATYCENRRDHVFWDFYHPTEAASRLFVDTVFGGSQPYVYPINLRELAAL